MTDREFRGRFGGDDPPADTSNTIITEDSMEAIVAVSEGPIRGLVDGAKSFYIGDTPLQSPDGSLNYKNFTLGVFNGYGETITSAQGGFGSATAVSVEMLTNVPVTRVITTLGIDFIDIRMVVNRLYVEDRDSTPFASIANLHVEWRPENSIGWFPMDPGGSNPQVDAQGYTVYNSSIFDRGPVAFWQSNTPLPSHTMGVWFKSNASNAPFVIIAEHWFAAKNSAFVPETGGSFPYWTWEQYDEVGTTLKSRAWTGPSYAGGLLWAPDDGGPARPGDYWLQTDTGQLMYYNGTNWVTANHGEHATEYPPSEFAGSGLVSVYQRIISSPVVWQFRFPVPRLAVPIEVRITKTSYSTHDDIPKWYSDVTWESAVAHIARQFRYPNLAIAQINAQASGNFSSIPDFSGIYYGRIVKVPSNYDTTNKTYAGTWDGIWRMDWTDNPAFIVKDLVENTTYGMGTFYHVSINDWDVYDAGQWCDSRAADGNPRFTFNGLIAEPRIGKEAIDYVSGIFSGRFVDDGNGYARILIDRSDTPAVQLFTKENVELGAFNYSFSDPTTRYNDLTIAFTNPDLDWQTDRRRLYWQTAMDDFGRVPYQFVAVGCTHVYEAYLRGRYVIVTSQTETLIVQFKTSRNGLNLNPYDIVLIADELIYGKPPNAEDLSGYFIQTTGNFTPLLAANTNQPLFISEYDLPEAATVYDKLKTGRIVLGQNSALGYTGGVITTKSSLTATDAYTVLLRDPIYLEAGLAYFVTFQTLTGTAEYRVDPSWAGSIKYDLRVTTSITQQLPEKAVFSLRVEGLSDIPKPFRVLTIAPTDSDDVVEVTAVEVNRKKWEYVDGFGAAINIKSSAIYFVIDRSQSLNSTQFSEEKQAVLNALNLLEAYVQLYPGKRIDIGVVFEAAGISFMERKNVTTANINELRAFINAAGQISGGSYHGAFTQVKVFFDSTINVPFEARSVIVIGDSTTEDELGAAAAGPAADFINQTTGAYSFANGTPVDIYCLAFYNPTYAGGPPNLAYFGLIDNTPGDGIPTVTANDSDAMDQAILFTLAHG